MNKRRSTVVVLAAGRGMRFRGVGHKLLQTLGDETVLSRTIGSAIATRLRVVVVTTPALEAVVHRQIASNDVVTLPAMTGLGNAAPIGMGYSIAAGVVASADADGWLILPGDMPMVQPETILAVADALAHFPVAYAQHRGRQGHPVGFSAELYSELTDLQGDEGARRIVARFPSQAVNVADSGVLIDVDTVEDLQLLLSMPAIQLHADAGKP